MTKRSSSISTRSATSTDTSRAWDRCWRQHIELLNTFQTLEIPFWNGVLLKLKREQVGPKADEREAQTHASAESNQHTRERANQKVFGEVSIVFEFIRPDDPLGRDKKCESGITPRSNDDCKDNSFEIADQSATIVFLGIDCHSHRLLGCGDLNRGRNRHVHRH